MHFHSCIKHILVTVLSSTSLGTLLENSPLKTKRTSQLGSFTFVLCLKIKHKRNIATHPFIYRKRGNAYATQGKFGDAFFLLRSRTSGEALSVIEV